MHKPVSSRDKSIQDIVNQGVFDEETLKSAMKEGKLNILEERRPLSDAHRAIIGIQDERFANPVTGVLPLPVPPSWQTALTPVVAKGMKAEWRDVLRLARQNDRVVCRHQFVSSSFVMAQHMLHHIRHAWQLPAAMAETVTAVRLGETIPDAVYQRVYVVPFYKVLQPRRRVVLPTLKKVDRVFSAYNR